MKTLNSLITEAEVKQEFWEDVSRDPQALKDRGKTKEEAIVLANYYEGKADGLIEAKMFFDSPPIVVCGVGETVTGTIVEHLLAHGQVLVVQDAVEPKQVEPMSFTLSNPVIATEEDFTLKKSRADHLRSCQPWKRKKKGRS